MEYSTQVERYGPYTALYGRMRLLYGRKLALFSSFTVRKRLVNDAVLIDLGTFAYIFAAILIGCYLLFIGLADRVLRGRNNDDANPTRSQPSKQN